MKEYIKKIVERSNAITCTDAIRLYDNEEYFCLYENGKEISVGIGKYIEIYATENFITIISEKETIKKKINDLCIDLKALLEGLEIEDWRMYGLANFSLARYTYDLSLEPETDALLHFFIPEKEYRINGNTVVLKSFTRDEIERMERRLNRVLCEKIGFPEDIKEKLEIADSIINYDEDYYKKIVTTGVEEIRNNNYQKVILSRKIPVDCKLDMFKTFVAGRAVNTPARSYICKMDEMEVVGFSPETVTEIDRDGNVYTFPLAGTRALTKDVEENKRLREELLHDTKEIAEHAVSVKLAAEELQQICEEGTVMVTEFMSIMERGTVQHLGSRLKGKMRKNFNSWHALCKLFPAVTASGIPKKQAIDAIGRIEKEPRGLYSGSVLITDQDGYMDAALVLRSIFQNEGNAWIRVGAGIVEMSNPEREFTETQEKVSSVATTLVSV